MTTHVDCISKNESFKKICLDKEILEVYLLPEKNFLDGEGINDDELNNNRFVYPIGLQSRPQNYYLGLGPRP